MVNIALNPNYRDFKLSPCELLTYGYINSFFTNNKDVFVKQSKLALELNYSLAQIKRARKSLIDKGLIVLMQNRGQRYYVPCMELDLVKSYLSTRVGSSFNLDGYINTIRLKQKKHLKCSCLESKNINASTSNLSTDARKEQKGTKVPLSDKNAYKLIYSVLKRANAYDGFNALKYSEFLDFCKQFDNPISFTNLSTKLAKWFSGLNLNDENCRFTISSQNLALFKAKTPSEVFYFIEKGAEKGLFNEPFEEIKKPMPFLFVFLWLPILLIRFNDFKVNDLFTDFVKNYGFYLNQDFKNFDEIIKYYIDLMDTHNGTAR